MTVCNQVLDMQVYEYQQIIYLMDNNGYILENSVPNLPQS